MNIFAYGTLMDQQIMEAVTGLHINGVAGRVTNYMRYRVIGEDYPGLISNPGGEVSGVVYLQVSDEPLYRLDLFEGEMYRREQVAVTLLETGERIKAMTYMVKPEYTHLLTSEPWTYDQFLSTGRALFMARYGGFTELRNAIDADDGGDE